MGLFDKLENKLEQGVNGAFARAFKSEVQPVEIASGIRRAMDDRAASVGKGKRPIVPNLFTIELSPTDYERLSAWGEELDDELIASAQEHADEQRYMPGGPLTIVLTEAHELETGVFRLRPATAKAADALAHQRNNPRPQGGVQDEFDERDATRIGGASLVDDGFDEPYTQHDTAGTHHDDWADDTRNAHDEDGHHGQFDDRDGVGTDEHGYHAHEMTAQTGPGASTGRTFGERIKDYLRGEPSPSASRHDDIHDHDAHLDDSEYQRDEERGYLDRDGRVDPVETEEDGWRHAPTSGTADPSWEDDEYSRYGEGDYAAAGFDDAHPDGRASGAHVAAAPEVDDPTHYRRDDAASHAWDDDDSDAGDPTGYAPAAHAAPTRPRPMSPRERPWLNIDGQRYPLLGAITVLGRDDDADIVIDDPGVSRRHSEVRITHDGPHLVMSLRDLGSTNGTFVNGERIDSTHVHEGDRLTLGRTPMTIHLGDRS